MKRRILIDVTHTFGHPHTTGVQRVVRRLAAWARDWPDTAFIRFDRSLVDFVALTPAEIESLIAPPPLPAANPKKLRSLLKALPGAMAVVDAFRTWRTWAAFATRPRRISFENTVYVSAEVLGEADRAAALRWCLRGDVKAVLVVHDLIPLFHPQWSLFNPGHFKNYLAILRRTDLVAAVSRHTRSQVLQWFAGQGRRLPECRVVRPGFDLPLTDGAPGRGAGLGRFLACVGTVEKRKNQVLILKVLRRLWDRGHDFSFVFAGLESDGGGFRREWLRMTQEGYPVLWWTPATEEEVDWLYSRAVATVYPSLAEGFGLPVVESLARGTPCITSSWSATGETAADLGGCEVVDPTDEDGLFGAMEKFLEDPEFGTNLMKTYRPEKLRRWQQFASDLYSLVDGAD